MWNSRRISRKQAVIAIENARLLSELRESLDRQTATSEVLGVISSSPGDLQPVFDTILQNATRLCSASLGLLALYDGDGFNGVAALGIPGESADALSRIRHPPPETLLGRLERTRQTTQALDVQNDPAYAEVFAVNPWLRQTRSSINVPMLKEGELAGAIIMARDEVRAFDPKEIELVENFAAQAVIAIENARLLTELRESLDRQTATSEVLGVISSSPGQLGPVFETMLSNALRLCEAAQGSVS